MTTTNIVPSDPAARRLWLEQLTSELRAHESTLVDRERELLMRERGLKRQHARARGLKVLPGGEDDG